MLAVLCVLAVCLYLEALLGFAPSDNTKLNLPTSHYDGSALLQTQISGRDLAARCTSLTVGIQNAAWAASHV